MTVAFIQSIEPTVDSSISGGDLSVSTTGNSHVLVIDDYLELREVLGSYLSRNGFQVSLASDATEAETILSQHNIDLIILDLMLPGVDGMTFCRNVAGQRGIPVMILSAKTDPIDRIIGLEIGAEDYLTKPFVPRELLVRIRKILERRSVRTVEQPQVRALVRQFSGWEINTRTFQLTSPEGESNIISSSDYMLLSYFLDNRNVIISRQQIADALRMDSDNLGRSVDLRVSRLRKKLRSKESAVELIRTYRQGGYMFVS